jgi:prophage regulatory protein
MAKRPPTTDVIDQPAPHTRLLTKRDICQRINRSYPTIWAWMQQGKFPRAKNVNGHPGWVEEEIEKWIASLPTARIKGDPQ